MAEMPTGLRRGRSKLFGLTIIVDTQHPLMVEATKAGAIVAAAEASNKGYAIDSPPSRVVGAPFA